VSRRSAPGGGVVSSGVCLVFRQWRDARGLRDAPPRLPQGGPRRLQARTGAITDRRRECGRGCLQLPWAAPAVGHSVDDCQPLPPVVLARCWPAVFPAAASTRRRKL